MSKNGRSLVEQLFDEAVRKMPHQPLPKSEPATIHWTELPEDTTGRELALEWNAYCRLVGTLLADGKEGHWVLMKGEQLLGIWETKNEALAEGYQRFPGQAFLVHEVQERERLFRVGQVCR